MYKYILLTGIKQMRIVYKQNPWYNSNNHDLNIKVKKIEYNVKEKKKKY